MSPRTLAIVAALATVASCTPGAIQVTIPNAQINGSVNGSGAPAATPSPSVLVFVQQTDPPGATPTPSASPSTTTSAAPSPSPTPASTPTPSPTMPPSPNSVATIFPVTPTLTPTVDPSQVGLPMTILTETGGVDSLGYYVTGTAKNVSTRQLGLVLITFNVYDARGVLIGTVGDNVSKLAAGQVWQYKTYHDAGAVRHAFKEWTIL